MPKKLDIYDSTGAVVSAYELQDSCLESEKGTQAVHDVVIAYMAEQRAGTASTKTRGEVSGSGAKPWRQKGTGRARQGSTRSPQWTHGGIALGPKPRDYSYTINRKTKKLAFRSAFSAKVKDNEMVVIDNITLSDYKTKDIVNLLNALGADKKALIVLPAVDEKVIKSAANIPGVKTAVVGSLNVYDILNYTNFIIASEAVDKLEEVYA